MWILLFVKKYFDYFIQDSQISQDIKCEKLKYFFVICLEQKKLEIILILYIDSYRTAIFKLFLLQPFQLKRQTLTLTAAFI